jgi:catechol 2,3-dioxygenase-like lactoylglutathione lyase family enzyme
MNLEENQPLSINHIGLVVPDLDRAVDWYQTVLSFQILSGPHEVTLTDSYGSRMLKDFFAPELKKLRLVHMTSADGVGLEIFEFIDPSVQRPRKAFNFRKAGFYHICVTAPNIESLTQKIVNNGGKQISKIWELRRGTGLKGVYCQDPFGNVIEIFTQLYEEVWAMQ